MSHPANLYCIDLGEPDINKSVSLMKQACEDCGFVYVVNSGISEELLEEVFSQSQRFFQLPLEEKMKVVRNKKHRGYTPLHDTCHDPQNDQLIHDCLEGYYIGVEIGEDDPRSQKPFFGPNQWPASDLLPGWRETMEKYHQEALEVAKSVSKIVALALDLDADFFVKPEILGETISIMRLLYYPSGEASNLGGRTYGRGEHTDYGILTLLATDDRMALQICKDKEANPHIWEYVPPMKGAFLVNLGDMLERWSNGMFRSTLHRVVMNGQERYSVAFFLEPNHECVVECLPSLLSPIEFLKYPPVTYGDYLAQKYKEIHADLSVYHHDQVTRLA